MRRRLPHADSHSVPGVDIGHGPGEFDNFGVVELGFEGVKSCVVVAMLAGQAGQRFGPGQRGALPLAVRADFAPVRQESAERRAKTRIYSPHSYEQTNTFAVDRHRV